MESILIPHTTDSHFHILEMKKKGLDPQSLLKESFANGLTYALDVAVDEEDFEERISYKKDFPSLFFSAGIHPSSVKDLDNQIRSVENQIDSNPSVKAIGETGIDLFRDFVPFEKQRESFITHIELASQKDLPLIIHSREADKEIREILNSDSGKISREISGVFHCFSSGYQMAKFVLDKGFYISFAGNITYKKSEEIREAATSIPLDSLLIETDSPYLSAQAVRGKINRPEFVGYTLRFIAELRGINPQELALITERNFLRFAGLN